MAASLFDSRGRQAVLGNKLGRGGEGEVFELRDRQEFVVKIYHQAVGAAKTTKLRGMTALSSPQLVKVAAWPVDTVHRGSGGPLCGIVMPRVKDAFPAHSIYSPKQRRVNLPDTDWRFLVRAARNATAALHTIHVHGHVVGDINQNGFLVGKDSTVRLIDCDSFQVAVANQIHKCLVGVPEFTPPELHGASFEQIARTRHHDGFGLAVLVFHFLFMGRHPFVGKFSGAGDMTIERAIREGRFAYGKRAATRQMSPPPGALPLDATSPSLAELFERAFALEGAQRGRPRADEWTEALDALFKDLASCRADPAHWYFRGLSRCPWCGIEQANGPAFFETVRVSGRVGGVAFDLAAIVAAVDKVGEIPSHRPQELALSLLAVTPRPLPRGTQLGRLTGIGLVSVSLVLLLLFFVEALPYQFFWASVAGLGAGLHLQVKSGAGKERERRRAVLALAQRDWEAATPAWNNSVTRCISAFQLKRAELQRLISEHRALPDKLQRAKQQVQSNKEAAQKRSFLERHFIAHASLSGIGGGIKMTLASQGFETAADLDRTVLRVPGIGRVRYATLMQWRASVETKFRFDPAKGVAPEIHALEQKHTHERITIERKLSQVPSELARLRHEYEQLLRAPILRDPVTRRLAQAMADVKVV